MRSILYSLIYCLIIISPVQGEPRWWKGNTHMHTLNSDGDSAPIDAVRWYRENSYQFIVVTDHNFITPVEGIKALFDAEGKFLVIAGNEISATSEKKPVHLCALNPSGPVTIANEQTIAATLQKNVDAITAAGGVAQINHPNFGWAFGARELEQISGCSLLEIWNFHPIVNNAGGGARSSTETIWDTLLSSGKRIYGVASDDTHAFKTFSPKHANPGRGWVCVRSERLAAPDILAALEQGDFYSSSGVELNDVRSDGKTLTVSVKLDGATLCTVEFIGKDGTVLEKKFDAESVYRFTGTEGYVRARITDSNGRMAWTQPVFVR